MTISAQSLPLPSPTPRKSVAPGWRPRWTLGVALGCGSLLWVIGFHFSARSGGSAPLTSSDGDFATLATSPPALNPPSNPATPAVPAQEPNLVHNAAAPVVPAGSVQDRASALAKTYELEAKQDYKSAADILRPLVNASPKDYFLRLRLAYLEACAKQYLEAAKDYAQAARLEPRSIEALLGQQQAALALGDFAGTEYLAKEITRRDSNNYLANSRLAWALFSQKRYLKARDVYAKVSALYPADTEMLLGLGYAHARLGTKPQAETAFRAVLNIVPADKRARAGLDELARK